jgi:hypothetical protein
MMRRMFARLLAATTLGLALLIAVAPARADTQTTIYLLTMGSGDDLYHRAGHAALEVEQLDAQGKRSSTVYNYGDADWKDPDFVAKFFKGTLQFRLSRAGTKENVLAVYGRGHDRDVWRQKLALTAAQAKQVAARLAREAKPDKRDYPYHHIERICTTRIRDLLDELTAGSLKRQLSAPHALTVRDYQPRGFRGHHLAFLGGDLLCGRLHDRPITDHYALYLPQHLRSYLQKVMVPDPAGGARKVPLVGKPERLYSRWKPAAVTEEDGATTLVVFGACSALLLLLALLGWARADKGPRLAGAAVTLYALLAGLLGLLVGALVIFSAVPELRQNELLLLYWPTDLLLLGVGLRWLRGRARAGRLVRGYAWLKAGVAALWIVGQLTGLLYQRPLIIPAFAVLGAIALLMLTRRVGRSVSITPTM